MDMHMVAQRQRASDGRMAEGILQNGSTQVAIMAGIVTMVSQPFAQSKIQALLGLAESFPVIVAIFVSVLLAAYQVFALQRAKRSEGLVLVPLVALIVFSSYTGTNQLLADDQQAVAGEVGKTTQDRMNNFEAQLANQKQLNDHLVRALRLAPEENPVRPSHHAPQSRNGIMDTIDKALAFFVSPAYGQDDTQRRVQNNERRRVEALLSEAQLKQKNLKAEQRRLEQASRNVPAQKVPLLKSW